MMTVQLQDIFDVRIRKVRYRFCDISLLVTIHHHHYHYHGYLLLQTNHVVVSYVLYISKALNNKWKQDAQLSQRDRAARCVTVFAKSRRLELGNNILRTL